jgi:hypothetical protein
MLAPQYSLRRLLAVVTLSGFVCLIVGAAFWGKMWGVAAVLALVGFVVLMMVHGALFVLVRVLGLVLDRQRQARQPEVRPAD